MHNHSEHRLHSLDTRFIFIFCLWRRRSHFPSGGAWGMTNIQSVFSGKGWGNSKKWFPVTWAILRSALQSQSPFWTVSKSKNKSQTKEAGASLRWLVMTEVPDIASSHGSWVHRASQDCYLPTIKTTVAKVPFFLLIPTVSLLTKGIEI